MLWIYNVQVYPENETGQFLSAHTEVKKGTFKLKGKQPTGILQVDFIATERAGSVHIETMEDCSIIGNNYLTKKLTAGFEKQNSFA